MASDLFELSGKTYVLVLDYYSRFVEVQLLHSISSTGVITALKVIFACHGIPDTLVSDNGPQYASYEMVEFAESYGFRHITSSPHYPQANGMAERTVKTVKGLLPTDPYMALLSYTLPWCQLRPAELLMGRRIRTDIPQAKKLLTPMWPYIKAFQRKTPSSRRHRSRRTTEDIVSEYSLNSQMTSQYGLKPMENRFQAKSFDQRMLRGRISWRLLPGNSGVIVVTFGPGHTTVLGSPIRTARTMSILEQRQLQLDLELVQPYTPQSVSWLKRGDVESGLVPRPYYGLCIIHVLCCACSWIVLEP